MCQPMIQRDTPASSSVLSRLQAPGQNLLAEAKFYFLIAENIQPTLEFHISGICGQNGEIFTYIFTSDSVDLNPLKIYRAHLADW